MKTLLQCIQEFIDNISVTDRQEENIKQSLSNLDTTLLDKENSLYVDRTFTNGSYERDTIIRPLDDIDMFAVLDFEEWKDQFGNYPKPQSVLAQIKTYLNDQNDYKGKVIQNRPCVTVQLSNKDFDILPSFEQFGGGYQIPNHDLESWTYSYPEKLTDDLNASNRHHNYKVKPTVKAIKSWNRDNSKIIPSYHIEETAINIFGIYSFTNFEESIRTWFNYAEHYLYRSKFKSTSEFDSAIKKVKNAKDKLNEAKKLYDDGKEVEAKKLWKDLFGKDFPTIDEEEAKAFSKALSEGSLKITSSGALSTTLGNSMGASKGFFNGISQD